MQRHHRVEAGAPAPLRILAQGEALSKWLVHVRRRAAEPPPEASKAAEWVTDNLYVW